MGGYIFDIKEFSVNDGPGVRTTVFLRGCPLRCAWCHNPEGLDTGRGVAVRHASCVHCGLCLSECDHPECRGLGRCLHACPRGLVEEVGRYTEADELAKKLMRDEALFLQSGGGVTLSGGEPLMQAEFVCELLSLLRVHKTIETSGFAPADAFLKVISLCDLVIMDIKLANSELHEKHTGVSNERILSNFRLLRESGKPYLIRIPLIPGVTDTRENLTAISDIVGDSPVELLPYNRMAPAKYPSVGKVFGYTALEGLSCPEPHLLFKNAQIR